MALTGLSLGGIIMLPVRKERNSKKSRQDEIARKNLIQVQRMEMRMQLRALQLKILIHTMNFLTVS